MQFHDKGSLKQLYWLLLGLRLTKFTSQITIDFCFAVLDKLHVYCNNYVTSKLIFVSLKVHVTTTLLAQKIFSGCLINICAVVSKAEAIVINIKIVIHECRNSLTELA